jgi:HEPN domain-containing protein
MDIQDKFDYWLQHAHYDLETAEAMLKTQRWLYVIFMCQQAVEKLVKGLYGVHLGFDAIPRIHNINALIARFADKLPQTIGQEHVDIFDLLTNYYLNNRYPDYMGSLMEQANEANAKEVFLKAKEAFAWLLTLKP